MNLDISFLDLPFRIAKHLRKSSLFCSDSDFCSTKVEIILFDFSSGNHITMKYKKSSTFEFSTVSVGMYGKKQVTKGLRKASK